MAMHFADAENEVLDILKEAKGKFLLPYQIFERIRRRNPALAQHVESE